MFSYYGSKSKIAKMFPEPKFDTIIEPFAGSAQYSLLYPEKRVVLYDKDETIVGIWKWLIEEAEEEEIMKFSNFRLGDSILNLPIDQNHKNFLGFLINRGSSRPANVVTKWSCQSKKDPSFASTVLHRLKETCKMLPRVRHWRVYEGSYEDAPHEEATWFVDPPYQGAGKYYRHGSGEICYDKLGLWCQSRKGQVIVCENLGAEWLPFKRLVDIKGCARKSTEAVWIKE